MSCRDFERLAALYVEGDLEGPERRILESHIRSCAACWDVLEDLKESQAVFKSIRQDLPDRAMLTSVRARVLRDVAGRAPGTWFERIVYGSFRQRATLAGVALMIAGAGTLWFSPAFNTVIEPPPPIVVALPPAVLEPQPLPQTVSKPRAGRAPAGNRHPEVAAAEAPAVDEPRQQLTVRLLTDDPNIIIYWLIDEKGD